MSQKSQNIFSSDIEMGKFLGSIVLIPYAYRVISETSSIYELHKSPSGIQVVAFNCSSDYTARFLNGEFGLVSSQNHPVNGFIYTKVNPNFSINEAAVKLFDQHLSDKLCEIENKLVNGPLVVTGRGLGGYLAILFALWKQHAIDVEGSNDNNRPICITFGSPLVGDEVLQQAISERPQWKSRFLNVVANEDRVATFFPSKNSQYKPFGSFMFCLESGGHTAFGNHDAILAVLDSMASSNIGNQTMYDYGNVLSSIKRKVLYRGVVSELDNSNSSPLRAGITSQFRDVGMLDGISNDLIQKMEDQQAKEIKRRRIYYEPTKKLNDMKISLTYMEWYMKTRKPKGGYYDCYQNEYSTREKIEAQSKIETRIDGLNQYWEKTVTDSDQMPQKEGAKMRKRWLYAGTNYRRIIEPLTIRKYYQKGKKDYRLNRPNHYTLLEKWSNEDKKNSKPSDPKKKPASLTEDSCFWADVEEALISLRSLKNGDLSLDREKMEQDLIDFESKLMGQIEEFSVSPDIFLQGSSLMKWWSEYKAYKPSSYASKFTQYMDNGIYVSYRD